MATMTCHMAWHLNNSMLQFAGFFNWHPSNQSSDLARVKFLTRPLVKNNKIIMPGMCSTGVTDKSPIPATSFQCLSIKHFVDILHCKAKFTVPIGKGLTEAHLLPYINLNKYIMSIDAYGEYQ